MTSRPSRLTTGITQMLGIDHPLVLAPMGGGPSTPDLVAAVSDAGGLGSMAAGYLTPEQIEAEVAQIRARTERPFAVNVFAGPVSERPEMPAGTADVLRELRQELGLPGSPEGQDAVVSLDEQIEVLASCAPPVVSYTFGLLDGHQMDRLGAAGCLRIGTATTVDEAIAVERAGADAVCAQGAEAGAHRGTFLEAEAASLIGTLALVPQVVDAVAIPVIAAGGVMDGRGLAAVLTLGAGAAQVGTAFLRCPEAGTASPHREALAAATETSTVLTSKVTGRTARGIGNRLTRALESCDVPPYPWMHQATAELRREAARSSRPELMALWCGQGVRLARAVPASELVRDMVDQASDIFARMSGRG